MIAFEFETSYKPDGTLMVPKEVAEQIPAGMPVRVILLVDEDRLEELQFMQLGAEAFLRDDSEEDAIYDRHESSSS